MSIVQQAERAVFLDKDGTIVENVPYNVDPTKIRLTEGAIEGLGVLVRHGYRLVIVTNQSGIARGYFSERMLDEANQALVAMLSKAGIHIDGCYYCPHDVEGVVEEYAIACTCRKPQPGMILRAAADLGFNLAESWCIGDILNDVEAGRRSGCHTILLDNGNETEWEMAPLRTPEFIAEDLVEAAYIIVRCDQAGQDQNSKVPMKAE